VEGGHVGQLREDLLRRGAVVGRWQVRRAATSAIARR
jgi:hypothetical protein